MKHESIKNKRSSEFIDIINENTNKDNKIINENVDIIIPGLSYKQYFTTNTQKRNNFKSEPVVDVKNKLLFKTELHTTTHAQVNAHAITLSNNNAINNANNFVNNNINNHTNANFNHVTNPKTIDYSPVKILMDKSKNEKDSLGIKEHRRSFSNCSNSTENKNKLTKELYDTINNWKKKEELNNYCTRRFNIPLVGDFVKTK